MADAGAAQFAPGASKIDASVDAARQPVAGNLCSQSRKWGFL